MESYWHNNSDHIKLNETISIKNDIVENDEIDFLLICIMH